MIDLIIREHSIQPTKSLKEVVVLLKELHAELAQRLHNGDAVLDMVPE